MAWAKGSPLVEDIAALSAITGRLDLENLDKCRAVIPGVLLAASDQLFAELERDEIDPTKLINFADYRPAVAAHAIAMLVINGSLDPAEGQLAPLHPFEASEPYMKRVGPELSEGANPGRAGRVIPRTKNINAGRF